MPTVMSTYRATILSAFFATLHEADITALKTTVLATNSATDESAFIATVNSAIITAD